MPGRKLVLPQPFTDTTLPILPVIDPIETPGAGSLLLIDATHPIGSWAAGVPANNASIPNLFAAKLKTAMATTLDADVNLLTSVGAGWNTTKGKLERSAKGGLHAIVSPTLGGGGAMGLNFTLSNALKTYLLALPVTDNWYLSMWGRVTKAPTSGGGYILSAAVFSNVAGVTSAAKVIIGGNGAVYPTPIGGVGRIATQATVGGVFTNNASGAMWSGGGKPANIGNLFALFDLGGVSTLNYSDALVASSGARITYRYYLENLTVSGRSYAQVDAIDLAQYTKEVLTAGGRYYADTFTDPTTIP